MTRKVTIIRQCWVGSKACRVGDVVEVDEKAYRSLIQAGRIIPRVFEEAMKLADPPPKPAAEIVAKPVEELEAPAPGPEQPRKKKRGRPRKNKSQ